MSDRFAFRFWSGDKMFYDVDGVFECLKQQIAFDRKLRLPIPYDHIGLHGAAFMQCTGLRDKNGKEIYEGDIVDAWVSRWPDSKTRGVVVWNTHCGAFQIQYEGAFGNNPTDFIHNWHFFEVIGNIYEHPHLIEQK